jgi:serine/threonine protein kinase
MITKYVNGGDLKALIYDKNKDKGFTEKEALMYLA